MGQICDPVAVEDPQCRLPDNLIGKANEVKGTIENISCQTLVDTGSQISTIAHSFYNSNLSSLKLYDCRDLLHVEGAGGDRIPYIGYIFAAVGLQGISPIEVPVLVVNDTLYNSQVPLLVGTNFLSHMQCNPSTRIPHSVQLARQSVQLVQRHLDKSNGVYGTLYASEDVTVLAGHVLVMCGNVRVAVPIAEGIAMVMSPSGSNEFDITPCLVNINTSAKSSFVEVANLGTTDLHIKEGEMIAELHQVTVAEEHFTSSEEESAFLKAFSLTYLEENASNDEVQSVKQMISRWQHIFSKDSSDLGKTCVLKHRIDLYDEIPIKERARRVPPNMVEELREHIRQLHSMGVIEESVSPWSSPIVIVKKKTGEIRMCVDYRKLNEKTIKDSYRIPTIEELIDTLGGAKWFATLDLSAGYHQVEIIESHREKTAFTAGPLGFWQFKRMPFGLTNAPALFQHMMERVLSGVHLKTALVYLDDIVVFGSSVSELKERLEVVFQKIHAAGLKLKAKKCSLFHQKLKYLGHIISDKGVSCDPEMLAPVKDWKPPQDVKQLQRFLGFANFFRRFIKGFASIAQPITELLGGPVKKKGKGRPKVAYEELKPWLWGETQQASFEKLREALTSTPVLTYPDFSKPFIVRTDASTHGLGAVLCQDQGDRAGPQVIAYASRSLKPSEKHYSPYKLEFLALFWAVTNKFQDYLKGASFTVWTDHNPLTYIFTTAKLDSTGHRWLAQLTNFNFSIKYKPGRHNNDADALSRMSEESVKAACTSFAEEEWEGYAQCMNINVDHVVVCDTLTVSEKIDWCAEQDKDEALHKVEEILEGE